MDLFSHQIRTTYRQHRGLVILFVALCAVLGLVFGYRLVGPAIFG